MSDSLRNASRRHRGQTTKATRETYTAPAAKTNGPKAILNTPTIHYGDHIADHTPRTPPRSATQSS